MVGNPTCSCIRFAKENALQIQRQFDIFLGPFPHSMAIANAAWQSILPFDLEQLALTEIENIARQ